MRNNKNVAGKHSEVANFRAVGIQVRKRKLLSSCFHLKRINLQVNTATTYSGSILRVSKNGKLSQTTSIAKKYGTCSVVERRVITSPGSDARNMEKMTRHMVAKHYELIQKILRMKETDPLISLDCQEDLLMV